jgi:uncharacterized protein with FMN-binding domain
MNSSSIKKYAIGAVLVVAFIAYIVFSNKNSATVTTNTGQVPTGTNTSSSSGSTGSSGSSGAGSGSGTGTSGGGTASTGQYKDGTYTSPVTDAFYGKLQVSVVVKGGVITDVTFPAYPNDNPESVKISGGAIQILRQEALTAQSANVDIVSGATQTSQAFQQALSGILTQAKA